MNEDEYKDISVYHLLMISIVCSLVFTVLFLTLCDILLQLKKGDCTMGNYEDDEIEETFDFKKFILSILCSTAFDFIVGGIIFYFIIAKVMAG